MNEAELVHIPEYVAGCIGKADLRSLAHRVRDMAVFLQAQECPAEAEHLGYVYRLLKARLEREKSGAIRLAPQKQAA